PIWPAGAFGSVCGRLSGGRPLVPTDERIRSQLLFGKPSALGKLWKAFLSLVLSLELSARLLYTHNRMPWRPIPHMRCRHARQFLLYDLRELAHLFFHFDHFLAHVQNNF